MDFQVIYPKEIAAMQQEKGALVVDLREWKEYQASHWPGARWYEFEDAKELGRQLPTERPIILYCDHGGMSMVIAKQLAKTQHIYSVIGGYEGMKKIQENYFKNGWNMRQ